VSDIAGNLLKIAEKEGFGLEKEAAEMLATLADGAMRDALSNLEQCKNAEDDVTLEVVQKILGVASSEKFFDVADAIASGDIGGALMASGEILGKSGDAGTFLTGLLAHFRDLIAAKALEEPAKVLDMPSEVIVKLKEQAEKIDSEKIIECMQKICGVLAVGKNAGMNRTLAESAIILMCEKKGVLA
jgi:DNA polymerase-3 subunit gamma/tau